MPYETYVPQGNAMGLKGAPPTMTITGGAIRARMIMNKAATHVLLDAKTKLVVLLWDKEKCRIGIRRAEPGDVHALSLAVHPGKKQCEISGIGFWRYIGMNPTASVRLPLTWNAKEKMFEAVLPKECLAQPAPPPLGRKDSK